MTTIILLATPNILFSRIFFIVIAVFFVFKKW